MTTVTPPERRFTGAVRVPADKSLSHRALLLAAMAPGTSRVTARGTGHDVASTRAAIGRLGVESSGDRILSRGTEGWEAPGSAIDCGNSGTTMRLLCGALAGSRVAVTLMGDESLSRRPMDRVAAALTPLGARIEVADGGIPPLTVTGMPLTGATVQVPLASAQVRTAVALAALSADGETTIDSPAGFRDHTERWLEAMGLGRWASDSGFVVEPGRVPPMELTVPGDASAAAYMWTAAAISPGSSVSTPGVTLNPGRIGLLDVLEAMGAEVERVIAAEDVLGDPIGDVVVTGTPLRAVEIEGALAVRALDELPLVAVAAGVADGTTTVRDAAELRVKESDRIDATVAMIRSLGGIAEGRDDGFVIIGNGPYGGGRVDSRRDHRIAMAAAVAAGASTDPVVIEGMEAADVSWPGFLETLEALWSSR